MDSVSKNYSVISATSFKPKLTFFPKRSNLTLNTFINKVLHDRDCLFANRSQVKSKFISIARLKTTELHQSAVQQIQYSKKKKKKIESKPSWQQSLKRALFKSQGEQIRFKSRLKTS